MNLHCSENAVPERWSRRKPIRLLALPKLLQNIVFRRRVSVKPCAAAFASNIGELFVCAA